MLADALPGGLGHANVGRTLDMHIAGHAEFSPAEDSSVTSPIIGPSRLGPRSQAAAAPGVQYAAVGGGGVRCASGGGGGGGRAAAGRAVGGAPLGCDEGGGDTRPMAGVCEHT